MPKKVKANKKLKVRSSAKHRVVKKGGVIFFNKPGKSHKRSVKRRSFLIACRRMQALSSRNTKLVKRMVPTIK